VSDKTSIHYKLLPILSQNAHPFRLCKQRFRDSISLTPADGARVLKPRNHRRWISIQHHKLANQLLRRRDAGLSQTLKGDGSYARNLQ
jgi:hypothetical protein